MELSEHQALAVTAIVGWYTRWKERLPEQQQVFRMFGYAGTGKTTIAKHIASALNCRVQFGAFTGKAALVLTSKGCPAQTLHRLAYTPNSDKQNALAEARDALEQLEIATPRNEGKIRRIERQILELLKPTFSLNIDKSPISQCDLLAIDEVSMVNEDLGQDIKSFNKPILVLGDPGQLPPIKGTGYFTDCTPDVMLTEIHRQARDNPIIALATQARSGEALKAGEYGSSRVIRKSQITADIALGVEQIITGSNEARTELNAEIRKMRGFSVALPQVGEKLICLRNNPKDELLNGMLVEVEEVEPPEADSAFFTIKVRDNPRRLHSHVLAFTDPKKLELKDYRYRAMANEFTFGYAITCHKAQGSQWDSVLVYDDSFQWDEPLHRKWSYTAITRAAERVIYAR